MKLPIRTISLIALCTISLLFLAGRPEAHKYQQFRGSECEVCGTTKKLEWAHSYPYNMAIGTDMEWTITDPKMGCTLCKRCHLVVGHLGDFSRFYNTNLLSIVQQLKASKAEYTKR